MDNRVLVRGIGELLTIPAEIGEVGEGVSGDDALGVIRNAAMILDDGRVAWVGPQSEAPEASYVEIVDVNGLVVMPGLVECHTHLVFAGNRAHEFSLRTQGATYEEIAASGGGIVSTVEATRLATNEELMVSALARLDDFLRHGVTTLEAKSGYGLSWEHERKILEVMSDLNQQHPTTVVSTFLGAHTVPLEFRPDTERYLDVVCEEMLPQVAEAKLATFCDVFVETGAFSLEQGRRVLETARDLGLLLKIHSEQLTHTGATALGAELEAVSADHLDFCTPEDARLLAEAGTVPVLLPGATFFVGHTRFARAQMFQEAGAPVALSTDYNPGSSHTRNLWLMGTMGCVYMGLSPAEALRGMTTNAARALGMHEEVGSLLPGYAADFIVTGVGNWEELLYLYGHNPAKEVYKSGRKVAH